MTKKDFLQKFLFEHLPIRGELVHLQDSYQTIANQHAYPPIIRQFLGEALVAATLLSALIKFKGRLSMQFQGKGQLKLLLVQCNDRFHLRGLAQWEGKLSREEIIANFQQGLMVITIDSEKGKTRYQGVVQWQGHSIAEALEGYFRDSEQLATRIWLAVDETSAAGLLLQVLPRGNKQSPRIEQEIVDPHWEHITQLTSSLKLHQLLHVGNEDLLRKLYAQEDIRVFSPHEVNFRCTCTTRRSENAIVMLGKEEVDEELRSKQRLVVTCDFCRKEYVFDAVDVAKVFKREAKLAGKRKLH